MRRPAAAMRSNALAAPRWRRRRRCQAGSPTRCAVAPAARRRGAAAATLGRKAAELPRSATRRVAGHEMWPRWMGRPQRARCSDRKATARKEAYPQLLPALSDDRTAELRRETPLQT